MRDRLLFRLIFPLSLSIDWTRPDDGPLSAFESTSKRRRADFCRPFHDDEPGSFKMVRKSIGDDLGHDLVRVVDALAALISQCESEGGGKVGRVGRREGFGRLEQATG